jgi:translation initiation factor 1A
MTDEYGDFEETTEEVEGEGVVTEEGVPARVRMPRLGQLIGVVVQRLGGNRMDVLSTDGKSRNCRVPGRYKRTLWLRPKDIVMIEPWPDDDSKADVVFKYSSSAINQLRKRGILNNLTADF